MGNCEVQITPGGFQSSCSHLAWSLRSVSMEREKLHLLSALAQSLPLSVCSWAWYSTSNSILVLFHMEEEIKSQKDIFTYGSMGIL